MPTLHLLELFGYPILQQLRIEEALLRTDKGNWCILNRNSPPAIVLGIGGKKEQLVNLDSLSRQPIPLIRRFSGGGTVYVDQNTLFVTLLCQKEEIPGRPHTPPKIHEWNARLLQGLFPEKPSILRANDYVLGERKFGGNAQYICKDRWLHHTSLLWDFDPEAMSSYLPLPERQPEYRRMRQHGDFLCSLRPLFPSKSLLVERIKELLAQNFAILPKSLAEIAPLLSRPHRKATRPLIALTTCSEII